MNGCQIFPSALRVAREDDAEKRLEHFNTLQSKLEELEQHMATTSQPYLGGLNQSVNQSGYIAQRYRVSNAL